LNYSRYYKNKNEQKPGWQRNIVEWCKYEAKRIGLQEADYWGGFVLEEMKIQVTDAMRFQLPFKKVTFISCSVLWRIK